MHTFIRTSMISVLISLVILAGGTLFHVFLANSRITLQEALLWTGFAPGACIALALFGTYFGKADTAYQIGRRAFTFQTAIATDSWPDQLLQCKIADLLSWICGGLLVCCYSYFL